MGNSWRQNIQKRKTNEELGLHVNIVQQLKSYTFFIDDKVPSGLHAITTLFLCELSDLALIFRKSSVMTL